MYIHDIRIHKKFFYVSQKNSVFPSVFMKILPNTSIYESILIKKISVNADIMNTQTFHLIKYDSTLIDCHKMLLLCLF